MARAIISRLSALLLACACAAACELGVTANAFAQKVETATHDDNGDETKFSPSWLPLINFAFSRTPASLLDDRCYDVQLWVDDDERFVSLSLKLLMKQVGDDDFIFAHPENCEKGQTFSFDGDGKFIRMVEFRD